MVHSQAIARDTFLKILFVNKQRTEENSKRVIFSNNTKLILAKDNMDVCNV